MPDSPDEAGPGQIETLAPGGFQVRMIAETVRMYEEAGGTLRSAGADAAARAAPGGFERRILVRAKVLDADGGLSSALGHARGALRGAIVLIWIFAAIAGAGVVNTVMESGATANVFVVLVSVLGFATLAFLAWLIAVILPSARVAGAAGPVARATAALARRIAPLVASGPLGLAATRALAGFLSGGAAGRWAVGIVTHSAWLAFLLAALAMMVFLLSTRAYVFVWETTILSAEVYVALTEFLSRLPDLVGFAVPTPEQVRQSEWSGQGTPGLGAREAWAGFLIGSLIIYGIAPRLIALALSAQLYRRARDGFTLDTTLPGYARLEPLLAVRVEAMGYLDDSEGQQPARPALRTGELQDLIAADPLGPVAVLGLEVDQPASGWPPQMSNAAVLDLGRVDSRAALERAIEQLRDSQPKPSLLVLVAALTSPPDRGMLAMIETITAATAIPLRLLLTAGQKLRTRAARRDVPQRLDDWHRLAERVAIAKDCVIEVDLDHLTETSLAKLAAFVGDPGSERAATDRLGRAFALVATEASRWTAAPDAERQAELHRDIVRIYRGGGDGWKRLFDVETVTPDTLAAQLRTASELVAGALPGRLAADRRWLTAGAMAGALGCVAAATFVVPGAIAGLPLWAGMGAAVAAAVRRTTERRGVEPPAAPDLADAVRSAALFALVLDAQGHTEAAITRLIDDAVGDDDAVLDSGEAVSRWLDGVHLRYRTAKRREAAR